MKIVGIVVYAVIAAYLVIFAVNNMQAVQLKLFFNSTEYNMPLFLLAMLLLFTGFLLGILVMAFGHISSSSKIKKLGKQAKEYQNEIIRLKNIAISGENPENDHEKTITDVEVKNQNNVDADIKNILR